MLTKSDVFRLFIRFIKNNNALKYLKENPVDILKNEAFHCVIRDWVNVYVSFYCPRRLELCKKWFEFIVFKNIDGLVHKPNEITQTDFKELLGTYDFGYLWKLMNSSMYGSSTSYSPQSSYYDLFEF